MCELFQLFLRRARGTKNRGDIRTFIPVAILVQDNLNSFGVAFSALNSETSAGSMCSILGLFAAALVQSAPRIPGDPHSHGLAADAASRNTRAAGARAGDAASERILSLLRTRRAPRDAWGAEDEADFDATYDPESAPEVPDGTQKSKKNQPF